MGDLLRGTFRIVGALMLSLLLFTLLFSAEGQIGLWSAASSAVEAQWQRSSLQNGYSRTLVYEQMFDVCNEYTGP